MPCLCVDLGWVTSNATLRVGSYNVTHHHLGVLRKNFVVVIFGVWISGLLQLMGVSIVPLRESALESAFQ